MKKLILLTVGLVLATCSPEMPGHPGPYFNLEDYLENNLAEESTVQKEVEINGETETQTISGYSFEEERDFLSAYNIDLPNYYGLYSVDTLRGSEGQWTIRYQSQKQSLKVESLEIQYGPSGIVKISGQANSSNILVKSDQTFEYLPGVEMTVENEQRILLQGTTRIRMHMKVNE